jgi:hypothetical protein
MMKNGKNPILNLNGKPAFEGLPQNIFQFNQGANIPFAQSNPELDGLIANIN